MLDTTAPPRSICQSPALATATASPERFLLALTPSSFEMVLAVLNSKKAHATINIDLLVPSRTLQQMTLEIESDKMIAETEPIANSEDQCDINGDLTDKEHWYDMDIRHIVHAQNTTFRVPAGAKIQSIIVHEIIDYHANHLFRVLQKQIAATIEATFATGVPRQKGSNQ